MCREETQDKKGWWKNCRPKLKVDPSLLISILSLLLSGIVAYHQYGETNRYYNVSKTIIRNELNNSLNYVDSYIKYVKKYDNDKKLANAFLLYDNELESQVSDINNIDKFKIPPKDVGKILKIQTEVSTSLNVVMENKAQSPYFLSNPKQKATYISALSDFKDTLRQNIDYINKK